MEMKENFNLDKLKSGSRGHRTDWGYATGVYITLLENQFNVFDFYISNTMMCVDYDLMGYGLTYSDLMSDKWVFTDVN